MGLCVVMAHGERHDAMTDGYIGRAFLERVPWYVGTTRSCRNEQ